MRGGGATTYMDKVYMDVVKGVAFVAVKSYCTNNEFLSNEKSGYGIEK